MCAVFPVIIFHTLEMFTLKISLESSTCVCWRVDIGRKLLTYLKKK